MAALYFLSILLCEVYTVCLCEHIKSNIVIYFKRIPYCVQQKIALMCDCSVARAHASSKINHAALDNIIQLLNLYVHTCL